MPHRVPAASRAAAFVFITLLSSSAAAQPSASEPSTICHPGGKEVTVSLFDKNRKPLLDENGIPKRRRGCACDAQKGYQEARRADGTWICAKPGPVGYDKGNVLRCRLGYVPRVKNGALQCVEDETIFYSTLCEHGRKTLINGREGCDCDPGYSEVVTPEGALSCQSAQDISPVTECPRCPECPAASSAAPAACGGDRAPEPERDAVTTPVRADFALALVDMKNGAELDHDGIASRIEIGLVEVPLAGDAEGPLAFMLEMNIAVNLGYTSSKVGYLTSDPSIALISRRWHFGGLINLGVSLDERLSGVRMSLFGGLDIGPRYVFSGCDRPAEDVKCGTRFLRPELGEDIDRLDLRPLRDYAVVVGVQAGLRFADKLISLHVRGGSEYALNPMVDGERWDLNPRYIELGGSLDIAKLKSLIAEAAGR